MNDIDKKILSLLQTNADIPIAELSKKNKFITIALLVKNKQTIQARLY